MGIPGCRKHLTQKLPEIVRFCNLSDFRGQALAIDTMPALYKFRIGNMENPRAHLEGIEDHIKIFLDHNVLPVYVFDGKPPEAKAPCLKARRRMRSKNSETGECKAIISRSHIDDVKALLTHMGVTWLVSPDEAEGMCSALYRNGLVSGVVSEDTDTLVFGGRLLHKMKRHGRRVSFTSICPDEAERKMGITHDQMIDACIMLGSDFCPKIRGIGPPKAFQYIQQYKSIEGCLEALPSLSPPEEFDYEQARTIFKNRYLVDIAKIPRLWNSSMKDACCQNLVEFCSERGLLTPKAGIVDYVIALRRCVFGDPVAYEAVCRAIERTGTNIVVRLPGSEATPVPDSPPQQQQQQQRPKMVGGGDDDTDVNSVRSSGGSSNSNDSSIDEQGSLSSSTMSSIDDDASSTTIEKPPLVVESQPIVEKPPPIQPTRMVHEGTSYAQVVLMAVVK